MAAELNVPKWSDIAATDKYLYSTPSTQLKVQDNYFNMHISPKVEADPATEESRGVDHRPASSDGAG